MLTTIRLSPVNEPLTRPNIDAPKDFIINLEKKVFNGCENLNVDVDAEA
jgi:hypothetical protein